MSPKSSVPFKVSEEKPVPSEPSFGMKEYLSSKGTVIERMQSGRVGGAENVRRLLDLKDQLDTLEREISMPQCPREWFQARGFHFSRGNGI